MTELRTDRLHLRPFLPEDLDALHAIVSHWQVVRQLGGWPWPADRAFTETRAKPYDGIGNVWAILMEGRLVGSVGVNVGKDGAPGIGYMLDPAYHQRGIMGEAARAAIAHGFARHDWDGLDAQTWHDNAASDALLHKLGFVMTGRAREMAKARGEKTDSRNYRLSRDAWARANPLVLKTKRLALRPLSEADAPALMRALGRPEVAHWLPIPAPWPPEACADWIAGARWRGGPDFRLGIEDQSGLIGSIGLVGGNAETPPALTYAISPEAAGQGYATEAGAALLADAFPRFGLAEVKTLVLTENAASIRVLEKLGFERIGGPFPSPKLAPWMDYAYRLNKAQFEARHEIP